MGGDCAAELATIVDALASEYGWPLETILALPVDVTPQLFHAMLHRKGVKVLRASGGTAPVNLSDRIKAILDTPDDLEPWQD